MIDMIALIYILVIGFIVFDFLCGLCYLCYKRFFKKDNNTENVLDDISNTSNVSNDAFILSFRRTLTEQLIISKVDELSKSRDIQFLISSYHYKNNRSIQGCVYIITSKIVYKLFFIKQSLLCKEIHTFTTFVSKHNKDIYMKMNNYFLTQFEKKSHHDEFYTWPHYYMVKNYEKEMLTLENFLQTF